MLSKLCTSSIPHSSPQNHAGGEAAAMQPVCSLGVPLLLPTRQSEPHSVLHANASSLARTENHFVEPC